MKEIGTEMNCNYLLFDYTGCLVLYSNKATLTGHFAIETEVLGKSWTESTGLRDLRALVMSYSMGWSALLLLICTRLGGEGEGSCMG